MSAEVSFYHDHISHYKIGTLPIRMIEVDVRDTAKEAIARHKAGETASLALAQVIAATVLLGGGHIKGDERISIQTITKGNLGSILADYQADGAIRARVQYPQVEAIGETQENRLKTAIGSGNLYVTKSTSEKEIYKGASPIFNSDFADALEIYFQTSEQILTYIWITTKLENNILTTAKGILIQPIGGSDKDILKSIIQNQDKKVVNSKLKESENLSQVFENIFINQPISIIHTQPIFYKCRCDEKRILNMIASLGVEEISEMINEKIPANITCEFCKTHYEVSIETLEGLVTILKSSSSSNTILN